ncbi:GMC family mycofactocin-associated oxidreductase [Williamsia limnetica]|uniref:GMC family mycofactocin-associated oxidreductase n=1 Tax=Williamsia limnetica TaxID=882452 RepID=A0A318RDN0_WILLI|nr:mycofactocin system GMC family oxidoreductase MftG [Williamsia limnetica]PYE13103.1 GMC family mycofactocin-associated oxidreductase [Williamsia limnetica]
MTAAADSRADVIVVGAGSSGCVVAERLSRDPARQVILLEAGGDAPASASLRLDHLPIGAGSDRVVHYPTRQGFDLPRGKGLGGSSAVNGGYFLRWHPNDFEGWSPDVWPMAAIGSAYDHVDGGVGGGGVMNVSEFADDELHPYACAFERHWKDEGFGVASPPWPAVGVVRVRSNRDGWHRHSTAVLLQEALRRPNLRLLSHSQVVGLRHSGGRVSGVVVGEQVLSADEVILCAGTLGTAELLARSGVVEIEDAAVWEHREQLVRFTPAGGLPGHARALLQAVLHTRDGLEIRCYNDDFAEFIDGLPHSSPAFGVALMHPELPGSVSWGPVARLRIDLGEVSGGDSEKIRRCAERVVSMLGGADFEGLVQPGSPWVEPVIRTSQHAWGTMPMGERTDWLGAVDEVRGLRIVDASILPTAGSSGPHATVMMMAWHIANTVA